MQSWAYINGHAIRYGVDLMTLPPNELFDFIEVELEDYLFANGKTEKGEGVDLVRNSVMRMYSRQYEYVKFSKLYGSRDTTPRSGLVDDGLQADSPFGSGTRPYLERTEQSDAGFMGLDAPLN